MTSIAPAAPIAETQKTPVFGPKLLYYPVECHDVRGCRIECYQNGTGVISRANISPHDSVHLVVNTGVSEEIEPRWIEIRSFDEAGIQTILLTRGTLCNLRALTIKPLQR